MGYTLKIGELVVNYSQDKDDPRCYLSANSFHHNDAPAFGEPTDGTSVRWPSYTSWRIFCRMAGLHAMFYGTEYGSDELVRDDALIVSHPGCVPLTERHRKDINDAMLRWKSKYPDAAPTYGKPAPEGKFLGFWHDEENPEENAYMCRLVWLHYWVNWALDNCKQPVFVNS